MSKQVKWSVDERVDVPDMQALGGLVESEFRRQLSQWLMGYEFSAVLRGFEVEADSPFSTRVVVRLDRSSDAIPLLTDSLALAAENLGTVVDFGVLFGGRSSDGNLEGAAQLLLDMSIKLPGTYVIEMRMALTTAEQENRAFWDRNADTEFVAATPTRIVPTWELQAVPAATGQEWLPLATVVWDGSLVTQSSITDNRFLLFEGFAALGFDAVHQNLSQFDFNRSSLRGAFGSGATGLVPAVWALQRQVLDLKGHDNNGFFNWYNRVFPPAGGGEAVWAKQTKSLRSTDIVTFTVGLENDYGDFNGIYGLNDCLTFIQSRSDQLPRRIKIVLKNRATFVGATPFFRMRTPVLLHDKDLEILHELGHSQSNHIFATQSGNDVRGQVMIDCDLLPATTVALALTGRSSLKMSNIVWSTPSIPIHQIFITGPVRFSNVVMYGYPIGWDFETLTCYSDQTVIENCHFRGTTNIGGSDDVLPTYGGLVRNTAFDFAVLRLRSSVATTSLTGLEVLKGVAQMLRFEQCTFEGRTTFDTSSQVSLVGMINARGTNHVTWDRCRFYHSSEENGVQLGNLIGGIDAGIVGSHWLEFSHSEYTMYVDNVHAYLTGANGSFGTGHHIFCLHDPSVTQSVFQTTGIDIHDNHFFGGAFGGPGSPDAGALALYSPRNLKVKNNRFTDWSDSLALNLNTLVLVRGQSVANTMPTDITIADNYFGDWATAVQRVTCLVVREAFYTHIEGNTFSRFQRDTSTVALLFTGVACQVIDCSNIWVDRNTFTGWINPVNPAGQNCNLFLGGVVRLGSVSNNTFNVFGGDAISGSFGSMDQMQVNNNTFEPYLLSETQFHSAINFSGIGHSNNNAFMGNRWSYIGGFGSSNVKLAIHVGDGFSFVVMGNHFDRGQIAHAVLGGVHGPRDVGYGVSNTNYVDGYV